MWRKVQDDTYIWLIKSEILANTVEIIDITELACAHEVAQLPYGCVVLQRVAWHEHDARGTSCLNDQLGLGRGCREWLFDEDVLASLDRLKAQLCVLRWWGSDDQGIHIRDSFCQIGISEHIHVDKLRPAVGSCEPLVNADDRCYAGARPEHAHVFRTPVTHSDDADSDFVQSRTHSVVPPDLVRMQASVMCKRPPRPTNRTEVHLILQKGSARSPTDCRA